MERNAGATSIPWVSLLLWVYCRSHAFITIRRLLNYQIQQRFHSVDWAIRVRFERDGRFARDTTPKIVRERITSASSSHSIARAGIVLSKLTHGRTRHLYSFGFRFLSTRQRTFSVPLASIPQIPTAKCVLDTPFLLTQILLGTPLENASPALINRL